MEELIIAVLASIIANDFVYSQLNLGSISLFQGRLFRISALALVIFGVIIGIIRIRRRIYTDNSGMGFISMAGKPRYVKDSAMVEEFGVLWRGLYGSSLMLPAQLRGEFMWKALSVLTVKPGLNRILFLNS